MARQRKDECTEHELKFAEYIVKHQCSAVEAARQVWNWTCEPDSKEAQRAKDIARSRRVLAAMKVFEDKYSVKAEAERVINETKKLDVDSIRDFVIQRLTQIRDSSNTKAGVKWNAIQALERLHAPSGDMNLLNKWMEVVWRFAQVHCPACHSNFPLKKIPNKHVDEHRRARKLPPPVKSDDILACRIDALEQMSKRRSPRNHAGHVRVFSAPERHLVVTGPARAGKSYALSGFAALSFLIPGNETWFIGKNYASAVSELEYFRQFMKTLFHPNERVMIKTYEEKKGGELNAFSLWGSILSVRTAASKGAITARELNAALIVEAGWVPADIYEEVRARMSSRLGRIIAFGTPKTASGFLHRMIRTTGRDSNTGKIVRMDPAARLVKNNCPWNISILIDHFRPEENPEYVQSELKAARFELNDEEYASEFEGDAFTRTGAKFQNVTENHIKNIPVDFFKNASFVLGVDQGPKNFAAVLTAWDGRIIVPCYEFFDSSEITMRANIIYLIKAVPGWIRNLGGDPKDWLVTLFDKDPPIWGILSELEKEGHKWPSPTSMRHENKKKLGDNWRRENQDFVNNMAKAVENVYGSDYNKLTFLSSEQLPRALDERCFPGALLLHQQVMETLDKPENITNENTKTYDKGWIVSDRWREDHVLDAWYLTMWSIYTGQLYVKETAPPKLSVYEDLKQGIRNKLKADEERELKMQSPQDGDFYIPDMQEEDKFYKPFSRGWYTDES